MNELETILSNHIEGGPGAYKKLYDDLERIIISSPNLFSLVKEMREAQRMYFKTRNTDWLQKSKKLEREVDQLIEDISKPKLF